MDGQFWAGLLVVVHASRRVWAQRSRWWDPVASSSSQVGVGVTRMLVGSWSPCPGRKRVHRRYGQDKAGGGISPPRPGCKRACERGSPPSCLLPRPPLCHPAHPRCHVRHHFRSTSVVVFAFAFVFMFQLAGVDRNEGDKAKDIPCGIGYVRQGCRKRTQGTTSNDDGGREMRAVVTSDAQ